MNKIIALIAANVAAGFRSTVIIRTAAGTKLQFDAIVAGALDSDDNLVLTNSSGNSHVINTLVGAICTVNAGGKI